MGHYFEAIMIHDLYLFQQSCLFGSIKTLIVESKLDTSYIKSKFVYNYKKNNGLSLTKHHLYSDLVMYLS